MASCKRFAAFVLLISIGFCHDVFAQLPNGISAHMLFPPRNYEMPLGDTVIPGIRIWNRDTVTQTGDTLIFLLRNAITNIAIYSNRIILPSLLVGDSLDTVFVAYISNPNTISEFGTFNACLNIIKNGVIASSSCTRFFGIRRTAVPFFDPSDNYGKTSEGDIPDQTQWCSIGATVVDGEDSTWDPPPPRHPNQRVGPDTMIAPVMRLDRKEFKGNYYAGTGVGDTLTSFPINLQAKEQVILSFDYMRGGREVYPLEWDHSSNEPLPTVTDGNGNRLSGDSLILEFRKPSAPVFNAADSDWNEIAAIDGGHDFEFKSLRASCNENHWTIQLNGMVTSVPDTLTNYLTADFRFRLRLKANNDSSQRGKDDAWYIDNPTVLTFFLPEVEVSWVKIVTPYTKVPSSQAIFPVYFRFYDLSVGNGISPQFFIQIINPNGDTVYSDTAVPPDLLTGEDTIIRCKDWDARNQEEVAGPYTVIATGENNFSTPRSIIQTYSRFYSNGSGNNTNNLQEFAMDDAGLDPAPNAGNNIPKLTGIEGKGIGFQRRTGSVAMKFHLVRPDTFYGVRVYFGGANQNSNSIQSSLWTSDSNASVPTTPVSTNQPMLFRRGPDFDQFSTYYNGQPLALAPGTYWIAVSQLDTQSMELGGNTFRGGAQAILESKTSPRIEAMYNDSLYGTQWGSVAGDNNGNVTGRFAYETPAGSGNWKTMTPPSGWWPAMDSTSGLTPIILPNLDSARWTGLGSYFPDIRPIFATYVPTPLSMEQTIVPSLSLSTYPNPLDPSDRSVEISFTLGMESSASMTICDVLGHAVRKYDLGSLSTGSHSIEWDGKDKNGMMVPSGIYLMEFVAGNQHGLQKVVVP